MGTSGKEAAWSVDGVLTTAHWRTEEVTILAVLIRASQKKQEAALTEVKCSHSLPV